MKTWHTFQKQQKKLLFSFNILDYKLIRKTYSDIELKTLSFIYMF
jgi:hypothetical protein